jgi:hypothetical protein
VIARYMPYANPRGRPRNASSRAASTMTFARASIGNRVSCSSATIACNSFTPALPAPPRCRVRPDAPARRL